jgi:Rieske 2Fe-2S family protein
VTEARETLRGREYFDAEVFELERERIFFGRWVYGGRAEGLDEPGDYVSLEVAGESVLVVVAEDGALHAFYNVCRHRGSQLCEPGPGRMRGAIKCPYHAWTYSFDGRLIGTPMVGKDEIDRSSFGLWELSVETWAGFLFVSFASEPEPLLDFLAAEPESPLPFARFGPLEELRVGHRTVVDVEANWKVHVDNYNECLHCPTVHPELVAIVPAYRRGDVVEADRPDGSVAIAGGGTSFTRSGRSALPVMPGFDGDEATSIFSACIFPNMFLDISGTSTVATCLLPRGPERTTVITEYLFRSEALDDTEAVAEIVEFNELVNAQDFAVCERVQRGVRSRAFDHGFFAARDELPLAFKRRYLEARGSG